MWTRGVVDQSGRSVDQSPRGCITLTPIDFRRCQTLVEYNLDHAAAPFPEHVDERNGLRGYTAAGVGLVNDIWVGPRRCTLDFLPGGPPKPDDDDRMGTGVA